MITADLIAREFLDMLSDSFPDSQIAYTCYAFLLYSDRFTLS